MFVVWKRPDGFHGAEPKDFKVVDIGNQARIWLHKKDTEWFPFRISGGWQEQESTQRLNQFVNLIGQPSSHWIKRLSSEFHHSMQGDPKKFFNDTIDWLKSLEGQLKGDTWEVEIMGHAIREIVIRVTDAEKGFLTAVN
jgi:hypothetical protein